jgi:sterol desaturase/sphingolipid hydroxylase (fatty acid hydroxylase superfamily)
LTAAAACGAFAAVAAAETIRPLRRRREPRGIRFGRNVTTAILSAAATAAIESLWRSPMAESKRRRGVLLGAIPLSPPVRTIAGILLLDYSLWWWHWMNHRIPLLWRFHLVHHVDRDLDASTGLRFHFGEMALSTAFRMAQVRILGTDPAATSIWQLLLILSVLFHHSNVELPPATDRAWTRVFVTPRMHGIHHSDYASETNSNWSSLLTWWDFLHGTFREDIPQQAIEIGVPAYQKPEDVTVGKIVTLPFRELRYEWLDPDGLLRLDRRQPPESGA